MNQPTINPYFIPSFKYNNNPFQLNNGIYIFQTIIV